jgi:hypothetical protein
VINISQDMKTFTEEFFLSDFMKISENLTSAELRMLYLLITQPEVIEFSQSEFAKKINVHRRTINIGMKKLKELNFISNIYLDDIDKNLQDFHLIRGEINVSERVAIQARKFIIDTFKTFYYPVNEEIIVVNEDFYSRIMGDYSLPQNMRYNMEYITEIIGETYPKCKFYFNQKKATYTSDIHYYIVRKINAEISKARLQKRYYIDKAKLIQNILDNYSLNEVEVMKVIKENFPGLKVVKNRIQIPKPWRGEK